MGHIVLIGIQSGKGHTHEVDQVISSESHCQGKCAGQHHSLHHVQPYEAQYRHHQAHEQGAATQDEPRVVVDESVQLWSHQSGTLQSAHQHEPRDTGDGYTAEDAVLHVRTAVEREYHTCQPLRDEAQHKGDGHTQEDTHDDAHGLLGIDEVAQGEQMAGRVGGSLHDLDQGESERSSQQLKHHTDGSGCGHTQTVEHIQQQHIGKHDGHEDAHHIIKGEKLGRHDAVAGHIEHAVAQRGACKHAYRGDDDNRAEACNLGSDGRIEEVHCIVAHTHHQVKYGQDDEEDDDAQE